MLDSATGTDVPNTQPPTAGKLRRFGQWLVFIFVIILVLISAVSAGLLDAPDAPVMAFWTMIACGILLTVLHATPVFFRLPKILKQSVYAAIPLYFVALLVVFTEANDAFEKTPKGKLRVEQRKKDAELDAVQAQEDAQAKIRQEMLAAQSARKNEADERQVFLAENPELITGNNWSCRNLINSVIAMSQDQPLKIYEINSPREVGNLPTHSIDCYGSAEWSNGSEVISYGARMTEGGNLVLEYRQGP